MKILVATKESQGKRAGDFHFAREGEIVVLGDRHDDEAVDDECGCQRSLVGLKSDKGTTTFRIVETNDDKAAFLNKLRRARRELMELGVSEENIEGEADFLLEVAARFPVGSIVEMRGDAFQARRK